MVQTAVTTPPEGRCCGPGWAAGGAAAGAAGRRGAGPSLCLQPPRLPPAHTPPPPQVYNFNVPTFGRGVVYDVDQRVRSEQFRFVADALRTAKLRTYVPAFKQVGARQRQRARPLVPEPPADR